MSLPDAETRPCARARSCILREKEKEREREREREREPRWASPRPGLRPATGNASLAVLRNLAEGTEKFAAA